VCTALAQSTPDSREQISQNLTNRFREVQLKENQKAITMLGNTVKCGYLLHYKKRVVGRNWTEKIVVLYSDSRLAWFRDCQSEAQDSILLSDAPELLAAGQWVWRIPRPPSLPKGACPKLAIACATSTKESAQWFLCRSQDDLIDWMKAINSTLPLPPPPPELYPSTIKPLDPRLIAALETLCQESFSKQRKGGVKIKSEILLGSCCTDTSSSHLHKTSVAMNLQETETQTQSSNGNHNRPEMQILKTRKQKTASAKSEPGDRAGAETLMMAGTSTQWEWGWGSGGGWLCGAWCEHCSGDITTGLGLDTASLTHGDDDTEDCDPGDADLGDFGGDFGGF